MQLNLITSLHQHRHSIYLCPRMFLSPTAARTSHPVHGHPVLFSKGISTREFVDCGMGSIVEWLESQWANKPFPLANRKCFLCFVGPSIPGPLYYVTIACLAAFLGSNLFPCTLCGISSIVPCQFASRQTSSLFIVPAWSK